MLERFNTRQTPQALLEAAGRFEKCVIPWLERDITKESWNSGTWRLMESPLYFLVKNRCLLDPAGNPFLMSLVYGDFGEAPWLYDRDAGPSSRLWEELPETEIEDETKVKAEFERSNLIADTKSIYLNTKKRRVENSLDKKSLRGILAGQLGPRMRENFAKHFEAYMHNPKERWRSGLFMALLLHCFSELKDKAHEIFDEMNESMGGKGEFQPEKISIGDNLELGRHIATACAAYIPEKGRKFDLESVLNAAILRGEKEGIFCISSKDELSRLERANRELSRHATYENVFMANLLDVARKTGVLSTSQFGWIKAFDRTLWYALCQAGRRVAPAEACGVYAHWLCEEVAGKAIPVPCVEPAIDGLETEMTAEGWLPKPEEEKC